MAGAGYRPAIGASWVRSLVFQLIGECLVNLVIIIVILRVFPKVACASTRSEGHTLGIELSHEVVLRGCRENGLYPAV